MSKLHLGSVLSVLVVGWWIMIKKNRNIRVAACIPAALIFILVIGIYINQLSHTTESSVVAFMEELSRHDMQNIQSELQSSWNELSAAYSRTKANNCKSIQEICSRLNIEQRTNTFDTMYLVDSNGNTYSSANVIQNDSSKTYIRPLLENEQKYVMRYDDLNVLEALKENLVYGVRCDPIWINNVQFIGIVGFSKINMIEERLKIDSFGGRGYIGIVDMEGNFVVNRNRSAGIGKLDNYFEQLQQNTNLSEKEISDLVTQLKRGDRFLERFKDNEKGDQVVSFIAIPGTTWSIVLTVPEEVFSEQTHQFVFMTGVMLVIVVVMLCLMMLVIIRISVISETAKADAKSRSDFLSNMSHEIRTPLNGIIGLNALMQQNTSDPEKLHEYLGKSDATAKYLLSLVNDVLDMSKLQAGKMELTPKPFSVPYLVSTIESIMRSRIEEKNIKFEIKLGIQWPALIGDETRIEQILMNILGNAVKFTSEGGQITMRVMQSAEKTGQVTTTYQVEDTGCGMSETFQKKIFDMFSQERNTVSTGAQGTGLGMSISYRLAKQMGGSLSVSSTVGKGSCFTFVMTAEIADQMPDTVAVADAPVKVYIGEERNILVAEDNELNAEILLEVLRSAGFSVSHAPDGGQVVEMFEASEPFAFDIILMDVQMPVRNGYDATKMIRALNRPDAKTVIIYACTANTFKEDQDKALESGMNGFIAKPIDINKLMRKLDLTGKEKEK